MILSRFVRITDERYDPVDRGHAILTSLEGENPGGSIKDHMVEGELLYRLENGQLRSGDSISEISAGSTARSLAFYARAHGLKCILFVPYSLPASAQEILRSMGAELHLADPKTAYAEYDVFTAQTGISRLDQFGRRDLRFHYKNLAQQALKHLPEQIISVYGGVGTGHSLTGLSEWIRHVHPASEVCTAEPKIAGLVSGIRNLQLESFGEKDPCDVRGFLRCEVDDVDFFPHDEIQTSLGLVEVAPSFRVVLGAIAQRLKTAQVAGAATAVSTTATHLASSTVFAIGAANKRQVADVG